MEVKETVQPKPAAQPSAVPAWMRPSTGKKIAYSLPYFGHFLLMAPLLIELQIFYTDTLLMPAGLLALIMAIARAWDALNDPIIGWVSDHTRTRWGRRIPYLAIGAPLTALAYWLMFSPPVDITPVNACWWLGLSYFLYYLFNTVWYIPYQALGFELSPDYNDRTSLFGYRTFLGQLGIIIGFATLFYLKFADTFEGDDHKMLTIVCGVIGIIFIGLFLVPILSIKENPIFLQFKKSPIVPGIRRALRNSPFRLLMWVMIFGTVPIAMPILVMPYFVKYVVGASSSMRLIYALLYVVAALAAIPVWTWIGKRFGKVHVWMVAISLGIVASLAMFFVSKGQLYLMGGLEIFRGLGSSAATVLMPAMIADIIDYDEFHTGKRREAQFGAFLGLIPKFIAIIAGAMPLAVLGMVGYDPAAGDVNANTHFAIRSLYALVPFAFHLICITLLFFYPLSAQIHAAIRKGVELHKQGKAAKDPLTGEMKMPVDAKAVPEDTGWYLDYFSVGELKGIVANGVQSLVGKVYGSVAISAAFVAFCLGGVYFLLIGAMSISQADQARQALASVLVFCGGLGIAVTAYHAMRIKTAKKMTADPVDRDVIQSHLDQI